MKASTLIIIAMLSPVILGIFKQFYGDMKRSFAKGEQAAIVAQMQESLEDVARVRHDVSHQSAEP